MSFFSQKKHGVGLSATRMEFFSDAVFAIAITLLILEIAVPELTAKELTDGELFQHIILLWPKFLSYIISFAILGIFWVGHYIMFSFIKRADRKLMWLNILILMLVSFFPFPAALIGEYSSDRTAIVIYGGTLLLLSISFNLVWHHATLGYHLIDKTIKPAIIKQATHIILLAPLLYLLAVILAFYNPTITLIIYIITPLLYIIPSPIDDIIDYAFKHSSPQG